MKTLVTFYSRTGNTKKIAQDIAKHLGADTDEIIDQKKRSGFFGFIGAGKDAMRKKPTEITTNKDAKEYDLIIIGTPCWGFTTVPAIRTFLNTRKIKKIAFFCTHGGNIGKMFEELEKISKKPIATLEIKDKELESEESQKKVDEFCKKIKLSEIQKEVDKNSKG